MTLALYFFRQFLPPFLFGTVLFMFVLLLDRLFDIVDLIFNKGVQFLVVAKLFSLFIPTILPLTFPMACLLACLVTFGRLSEENELTAVRAAGISLYRSLWMAPFFALLLSVLLVPFNTRVAPWSNRAFRQIYEKIVSADPLINIEPKKFFAIKNVKIFCESVDKTNKKLKNLFIYQTSPDGRPAERIFSRVGEIESTNDSFTLYLQSGQAEKFDQYDPLKLTHTSFGAYTMAMPLNQSGKDTSTRFRNISSPELKSLIRDLKRQNLQTGPLEAEFNIRYALAFAPFSLVLMGIPLATALRKGGKGSGFGVSIAVIFAYYTLLIFGLTLAEKNSMPAAPALWMANIACLTGGFILLFGMRKL